MEVEDIWKGQPPERIQLTLDPATTAPECGRGDCFRPGVRWMVEANKTQDGYTVLRRGFTDEPLTVGRARTQLGESRSPEPSPPERRFDF